MREYRNEGKPPKKLARYMSRTEVAEYLGLKSQRSLSKMKLPPPDALIGSHRGWLKSTIDQWHRERPGRGNWGENNP